MLRAISGKTPSLQMVYAREHCNKLYTKYIDIVECLIKLVGKAPKGVFKRAGMPSPVINKPTPAE
jgi:hypothetical protein